MQITAEQLETILTGLHTEAKRIFRRDGRLTPALLLISDEGASRLISMPDGLIDENRITEHARAVRPTAILLQRRELAWVNHAAERKRRQAPTRRYARAQREARPARSHHHPRHRTHSRRRTPPR